MSSPAVTRAAELTSVAELIAQWRAEGTELCGPLGWLGLLWLQLRLRRVLPKAHRRLLHTANGTVGPDRIHFTLWRATDMLDRLAVMRDRHHCPSDAVVFADGGLGTLFFSLDSRGITWAGSDGRHRAIGT